MHSGQTQQADLIRRHRVAGENGFPDFLGGVVEEAARGAQFGFRLGHLDAYVGAVGELGRAGDAAAGGHAGHFVERGAAEAEVDHGEHLGGVGDGRIAVERLVDGRFAAADEGPAVLDEGAIEAQVMAAGAFQANHVPVLDDFHPAGRQQRGTRPPTGTSGADADTEHVGALAAAGELPGSGDLPTALHRFGGLQREQASGEHQVRTLGIQFSLAFLRQCGEIGAGAAETGDPAGGAIGFRDTFDHAQEFGRCHRIAAEAFRRGGTIDADLLETLDHVARHMAAAVELLAALTHLVQDALEVGGDIAGRLLRGDG
ncbi:hypothetical protein D3C81_1341490 [compost metagenome]